jgi:hypothetical protein
MTECISGEKCFSSYEATRQVKINAVAMMVATCGLGFTPIAFADLFKCTVRGKIQYQQTACDSGEEKALDDRKRRMHQRQREAKERVARREAEALVSKGSVMSGNDGERKAVAEKAMRSYFEQTLIDPSSIQFRNLQVYLDVPGSKLRTTGSKTTPLIDVVCDEMNSKNRMGGYVGSKHFYWDSDEKKAVGPMDSRELGDIMEGLARRSCANLRTKD